MAFVVFGGMLPQMPPNLCPCCSLPLVVNQAAQPMPCCPISPEIEQKQKEIWAEFDNARLLQSIDLSRHVSIDNGNLSLMEFFQHYHHFALVWESVLKATANALLQIVYVKGQGCKLLKWS